MKTAITTLSLLLYATIAFAEGTPTAMTVSKDALNDFSNELKPMATCKKAYNKFDVFDFDNGSFKSKPFSIQDVENYFGNQGQVVQYKKYVWRYPDAHVVVEADGKTKVISNISYKNTDNIPDYNKIAKQINRGTITLNKMIETLGKPSDIETGSTAHVFYCKGGHFALIMEGDKIIRGELM